IGVRRNKRKRRLNMKSNLKGMLAVSLSMAMLLICGTSSAQDRRAAYEIDIDWAANDTGTPDCPWLYAPVPDCLLGGNRSCVISHAIDQAKANQDFAAFGLVLITQCHNPGQQKVLVQAGPYAVANYLRRF